MFTGVEDILADFKPSGNLRAVRTHRLIITHPGGVDRIERRLKIGVVPFRNLLE